MVRLACGFGIFDIRQFEIVWNLVLGIWDFECMRCMQSRDITIEVSDIAVDLR